MENIIENVTGNKILSNGDEVISSGEATFEREVVKTAIDNNIEVSNEDVANISNPFAISFNNVNIAKMSNNFDSDFSISEYKENDKENWDSLTKDTQIALINNARSEQHAEKIIAKRKVYNESLERFNLDDNFSKYGSMLFFGVLDPTIFVPYAGAVGKVKSIVKAQSIMTRTATNFATLGTVGAVTNVASESLFEAQNLHTDYSSAALIGFLMGGGLPSIADSISLKMDRNNIYKALNSDTLEKNIEQNNNVEIIYNDDGSVRKTAYHTPDDANFDTSIDKFASSKLVNWTKSSAHFLHETSNRVIQKYVRRGTNANVASKDKNSNYIADETSGNDFKIKFESTKNKLLSDNAIAFRNAKVDGYYKGDITDWNEKIQNDTTLLIQRQEIDTDNFKKVREDELILSFEDFKLKEATDKIENTIKKKNLNFTPEKKKEQIQNALTNENNIKGWKKSFDDSNNLILKQIDDEAFAKFNKEYYLKGNENADNIRRFQEQYFNNIVNEGRSLKIDDYNKINTNKFYTPTIYSSNKINAIDDDVLFKNVREGMIVKKGKKANKEFWDNLDENAKIVTQELKAIGRKGDLEYYLRGDEKIDGQTNSNKFLKDKKYELDQYTMRAITENDLGRNVEKYHFRTSGEFTLKFAYGKTNKNAIVKDFSDELNLDSKIYDDKLKTERDMTQQEILDSKKYFLDLLDNLSGVSVMKSATKGNKSFLQSIRLINGFNSLTFGGGFGLNSLAELPSALLATDSKIIFMNEFRKALFDSTDVIRQKGKKGFVKEVIDHIGFSSALLDRSVNTKFNDVELSGVSGGRVTKLDKTENLINKGVSKLFEFNGMKSLQGALEAGVMAGAINDMKKMGEILSTGGKLSSKQELLARKWGLTDKSILDILPKILDASTLSKFGNISDIDLDRIQGTEAYEKVTTAVRRAISQGVLQGDDIHLPQWMIEAGPFVKLTTVFLRFAFLANDNLLRRGWTEETAGMIGSGVASMMMFSGMLYLREQAAISAGLINERDSKYDYFGNDAEEAWLRGFGKTINYIGPLGILTIGTQDFLIMTNNLGGQEILGREYADNIEGLLGVNASRAGTIRTLLSKVMSGDVGDEQSLYAIKSLLPFVTLPIITEFLNMKIKEYGE